MKKLLALISAFCVLLLCGCNDNKNNENSGTTTTTSATAATSSSKAPSKKIEHIAQKLEQGMLESFEGYSDEEKEQIKQAVENDGYTLEFKEDGSGVLSNEEGAWTVAKGWVDNEITKGVPKVDFGMITMSFSDSDSNGEYYMFLIRQASYAQVKNYIEKLKTAGYTNVEDQADSKESNALVYVAKNQNGKRIAVGYSSNGFTVQISK